MHVLVSGASGFIGVNLCHQLLLEGHTVTGIDNFYCSNESNMDKLFKHKSFTFIKHDIITSLDTLKSLQNRQCDVVCNFACPASPAQYLKDPIYTAKVSFLGVLNMLEFATAHNIPLLQASTSEIYGDPIEHPQNEKQWGNVNSIGPRACYDEGKRIAESLCFDFIRTKKTKVKMIRIFNTYGPHMAADDGRVVSNFITQALTGKPLTIYGDGTQTRSFCFIDDLVRGIISFIKLPTLYTNEINYKIHGPINLGSPDEITIKQLVTHIQAIVSDCTTVYADLPENDPQQRKPDITRAKEILDWEPVINLEEGVKKTTNWFCREYNLKNKMGKIK